MRILILFVIAVLAVACKKKSSDCRLHLIYQTSGNDSLLFHYNVNGTIDYVSGKSKKIEYKYTNGFLSERKKYVGGVLTRVDTIRYQDGNNISSVAVRYVSTNDYEKTQFRYSGGKLTGADFIVTTAAGSTQGAASFSWTGNNITDVIFTGSSQDTVVYTYSQNLNPFVMIAADNILKNPEYMFTASQLYRVPIFYSENAATGARRYGAVPYQPAVLSIAGSPGRPAQLLIAPTNENYYYEYFCSE